MRRTWIAAVGTATALMLALAGCGNASAPSAGNAANGTSGGGTSSGSKTLVFGRGGDSVKLDPADVTDGESFRVTQQIYETLVDYKPGTFDIQPRLATDWSASSDGLKWTFHLRKGVKFQDGTDFNADAVVFNFDRWMDKSNPYHKGDFEYFASMFGGFKGDPGLVLQDVKKVDEYTVEFDLKHPFAPFLADMAMPCFAIASPKDIQDHQGDIARNPVGTGPFEFVSWKQNDKIVLKKNPNYWQSGLPHLDQVVFQVIQDNKSRLNALQSGELDIIDGVNPVDVQTIKSDPNLQLFLRPSNNVGYLAFNTQKKPFNDVRVRQAINMAIDKKAIVDAYFNGLATPAVTPLPPTMWGNDTSIQDYPVDIAKAKQLLAEAGYPNGFQTELWAMPVARPYMPDPQKIAAAIQDDLKKIGIQAKIVTYDWATYLKKTANGEHTMCLLGWSGDNGDPDDFLYVLLDSDNAKPPAQNVAFYVNPQVHQLLTQAQKETDQQKRAQLYKQAEQIIFKDAPWVPLDHSTPPLAASKKVTGFVPSATGSDELLNVDIQG
ncbi:ABC transporter substrate-binding protein [Alicyclobacillus sp.]|uniref:ABC transporter substrate-binding protein n=1 Tax=Alicyclobacillus sp. TaxID=61169 RepID=UPI0025B9A712|nr:ABC transporter substrate-binding protein [Alicyclobacillus sp.]